MSKKYAIYCENCNVLLNNDDDIFGTNFGQLYHSTCMDINHGKSADCQSQILFKMNLKFAETPELTTEAEEESEIMELEKSNNAARQHAEQLEARIKTLEDTLLQTKSDGNKLTDCVETVEKNKVVDNAPDNANNITQDPKASKETHNENNLSVEHPNDTENVASTSEEHHTCIISEEKQEVVDLRRNCVLIEVNVIYNSLDEAFSYVRKLANEMNAQIADNSLIHIDIEFPYLYVYFRDMDSKVEFLKNRFIYEYHPNTEHYLRILDYTNYGILDIKNFESSDLSLETAFVNVDGLAKKLGLINIRNSIDHIDVYSTEPNYLTYSVRFNSEFIKKIFVQNRDILKEFLETKFLEISDVGGHSSKASKNKMNYFNMAQASANVIGVAGLMDLSLSTDNFKRIYVLNTKKFKDCLKFVIISLVVEFSSSDIKNKFLKKKSELNHIDSKWCSDIDISDIETEGNIVSIKYNTWPYMFTAMSFIGLAKQLAFSFTPDQTDLFIQLSKFIFKASINFE